jgi:hypothetical protein
MTKMKTTTLIMASLLGGVIATQTLNHLTAKNPNISQSLFTPAEHQARHDAFAEKLAYYQAEIDRGNKRQSELRSRLRDETNAGRVALLQSDLEECKRDLETYLEKFSTAHRGMLRSKHWIEYGGDNGLWKDLDGVTPEDL